MREATHSRLSLLVCAICIVAFSSAVNPGLKIKVTQNGLDYAARVAMEVLTEDIQGKTFAGKSGQSGRLEYSFTDITVSSFKGPATNVDISASRGIRWVARGASIRVNCNWRYKYKRGWFRISDHGSLEASVTRADFSISVKLGKDSRGGFTIETTGCSSSIGDLDLDFRGGASWLYNLISGLFKNYLKEKLEELMCSEAKKAINDNAAKNLAKLKLDVPIKRGVMNLDYKQVNAPVFHTGYMDTFHKGEVFWTKSPNETPFQPGPAPALTMTDKMIYMFLSDYVMNSMAYVMHRHDQLQYSLTPQSLSARDRSKLATTCQGDDICVGAFLHRVAEAYPNSYLALYLKTTAPPTVSTTTHGMVAYAQGDINFSVQLPNGTVVPLFTVNTTLTANLTAGTNGRLITGRINEITPWLDVTHSVLPFSEDQERQLTFVFNTVVGLILPSLNELGAKGFEIPNADNVAFVSPSLKMVQGGFLVSTDVKYI